MGAFPRPQGVPRELWDPEGMESGEFQDGGFRAEGGVGPRAVTGSAAHEANPADLRKIVVRVPEACPQGPWPSSL